MKIYHELLDGTRGVCHLNPEKSMRILIGNPVFTTISSETMNPFNEFPDTSKIIR